MRCTLRQLWWDRRGATAIGYGSILATIVIAVAGLGDLNGGIWNGVATNVMQPTGSVNHQNISGNRSA